jgi:putative addiction module killer protein
MTRIVKTDVFDEWLSALRDRRATKKIAFAVERLAEGLGNIKRLGPRVSEVKIDCGPGCRLYFTRRGAELAILLCGGDKSSQARDIAIAERMAMEIE